MIYRLNNKIRSKGKNSDNMLLNEFIIENKKYFRKQQHIYEKQHYSYFVVLGWQRMEG